MAMTERAKRSRAQYQRLWRQRHPDKCRLYRESYWERRAAREFGDSDSMEVRRTDEPR